MKKQETKSKKISKRKQNRFQLGFVGTLMSVCLIFIVNAQWSIPGEDPDWYDAYAELIVDWEDESIRDDRLPQPSDEQYRLREIAREQNLTELVLEDLNKYE